VCIDEMTGIQALERKYRTNPCVQVSANAKSLSTFATAPKPPTPGGRSRRKAAAAPLASFDVARGAVISRECCDSH